MFRVDDLEFGDEPGVITGASASLPALPHVPVVRFPDVALQARIPSPVTDALFPPDDHKPTAPLYPLVLAMAMWEQLVGRMAADWPPMGWFGAGLYADRLEYRDEVMVRLTDAPEPLRNAVREALDPLDAAFRDATVDDGGAALIASGAATAEGIADSAWYWHRRPPVLSWEPGDILR